MGTRICLTSSAVADLNAIVDAVSRSGEEQGNLFVDEIRLRLATKLAVFPQSDPTIGKFHYALFGNYVAIYGYDGWMDTVTIFMLTESHRNWRASLEALA